MRFYQLLKDIPGMKAGELVRETFVVSIGTKGRMTTCKADRHPEWFRPIEEWEYDTIFDDTYRPTSQS